MLKCGNCGQESSDDARFCFACGHPLVLDTDSRTRHTATILFVDVTGFTALGEGTDPESVRVIMSRFFKAVQQVILDNGGTVEKFIGDAVIAIFGIPVVHEDDALRAVKSSLKIRQAVIRLSEELKTEFGVQIQTRTGIATGEVYTGSHATGHRFVSDPAATAGELQRAAQPGEVLLGDSTYRLVRNHITAQELHGITIKGRSSDVIAFRLI